MNVFKLFYNIEANKVNSIEENRIGVKNNERKQISDMVKISTSREMINSAMNIVRATNPSVE